MFKVFGTLKFSPALAFVVLGLVPSASWAQRSQPAPMRSPGIFSQTSIEKGWQSAVQQQQPMLVMFTSENCRYCKKMLAETYGHPVIRQMLAANTQTVLAHADDYQSLVKRLGIRGYPSSVLLSPQGDVLDFMQGYVPPKEFAQRIGPLLQAQALQARAASLPHQTAGR